MTDHGTGTTSNVSQQIEDGVESCGELDGLILDDTESVSGGLTISWFPGPNSTSTYPQYVVEDKVAEQIYHSLLEILDILQALPYLPNEIRGVDKNECPEECHSLGTSHPHTSIIWDFLTRPPSVPDEVWNHGYNAHTTQHCYDTLITFSKLGIGILAYCVCDPDRDR